MVNVLESLGFTINKKKSISILFRDHIFWVYYGFSEVLGYSAGGKGTENQ